jgi:protein-tyrosine phosphatase
MYTQPFWIEGKWPGGIAVSPRPRGGDWLEDEMKRWRRQGVDVVVSLLMPEEIEEFELQQEQSYCEQCGMLFCSLSIIDRSLPNSIQDVRRVIRNLESELSAGKNIVVHCRQGIGRSGLIAIALLMQKGQSLESAVALVSKARGRDVPETSEQLAWLRTFAPDSGGQETRSGVLK